MRKSIVALEDLEIVQPVVPTDAQMQDEIHGLEKAKLVLDLEDQELQEAEDASETLATLTERVVTSIPTEGISNDAAQALQVAVEHFCKRLQYKKSTYPAMEAFDAPETRVGAVEQVGTSLTAFSTELDEKLVVAQEGFIDIIGKHFVAILNSDARLRIKLNAAVADYRLHGGREGSINPSMALRRSFSHSGRSTISGSDVLEDLNKYELAHQELHRGMDKLRELSNAAKGHLRESVFEEDKAAMAKLDSLQKEADLIARKFAALKKDISTTGHGEARYAALTKDEVERIATFVGEFLDHKTALFDDLFGGHEETQLLAAKRKEKAGLDSWWEYASGMAKTRRLRSTIRTALKAVSDAYVDLSSVSHGAIAYIKASTN